jgi:ketosteroid isomerase-like protein
MSQENVEVVQRLNDAFNSGDVEACLDLYAPDAELRDLANAPDQSAAIRGREAIKESWTLWTVAFDEFRADIEEYIDRGDIVICAVHWIGQGRSSGMSVDTRQFDLLRIRGGRVISATLGYSSMEEALEAAGLPE